MPGAILPDVMIDDIEGSYALGTRNVILNAHRPRHILNLLLAYEIEGTIEFALQVVERCARYHHAARLGELFQPRGDIDPIAIEIAVHERYIAQIKGGELHQIAEGDGPILTTGQGGPSVG